jgi:hypothetical protein
MLVIKQLVEHSNFLGQSAGNGANANNSNFFGLVLGYGATGANASNFIGSNAGLGRC